ncbi:STAS domain-containing protein [Noviherbaspirillum sp.]|jgi:anti-anti-sigma factor|uniref:STAS domain-containing protein n=1 Tax=Noviherbaspirillum sp. TaxID=1926288 RepID=UPI0025DF874E|nr:STAS domain-containing protein [Noviherbaspirillum sp.]
MNADNKRQDGARPELSLSLEGEMTIYQAAELKQLLLTSLAQCQTLEIDLSAITEIDAAGVQLLIAAKKAALAAQKDIRLAAHSAAVTEAFELLDMSAFFGDPMVITA